jgi:NAD+-dependent protein deacetylase sirtuin 5
MLVIRTSAVVYPAAEYIDRALSKGARLAVVDISQPTRAINDHQFGDDRWYFHGDAAEILLEILKGVIGNF